jgi:hypothetical protein
MFERLKKVLTVAALGYVVIGVVVIGAHRTRLPMMVREGQFDKLVHAFETFEKRSSPW